ncbi:solute carrier family 13 member 5-like [Amphibalanus amphitrite]|uniref:solute carrier family 13 member 5-like n=1 Tax=Amphibalanus amphitrite TaxID=1232801 RepID=UPI001C8FAD03|nr:solute carrier family 13 member 5-like [Amphibalanus amphitrite]
MVRPAHGGSCVRAALRFWRTPVVVLTPLLALIVPLLARQQNGEIPQEALCGYSIIVMAVYWMTEALPIQVTALLPVVLFPITGVLTTKEVCGQYMTSANMLFFGGLMVAAAVEHSNLHLRIALRVLSLMGTGIKWLMLGFMGVTMFLSMWISNTATTAMMAPIIERLVNILVEPSADEEDQEQGAKGSMAPLRPPLGVTRRQLSTALYISVAYAANCGGTGTLTGTNPNLVLKGQLDELFGAETGLTYANFMLFGVPSMLLCTLLAWIWLVILFLGIKQFWCCKDEDSSQFAEVKRSLQQRYRDLGPMSFHEGMVLFLFVVLVLLWFLRSPRFIPGWAELFPTAISDATPAIFIVVLMFIIPAKPNFAFWSATSRDQTKVSQGLLTWKAVHEKVPWGVLVLLGGGFAMARAAKDSGLSVLIGDRLSFAFDLPPAALVFIVCLFTAMVTEVSSNTATATVLLPVLAAAAQDAGVNPIYLMLPTTMTCSYAFMLPVATPPNAIVHQAGGLKTKDMIRAGALMNVLCVAVITLMTNTLGVALFDLHTFPAWANVTRNGTAT